MDWTIDQILALAPDAFSLRRAQAFAAPAAWATLGKSTTGAWGTQEVDGYTIETGLDLASLAYTCMCPQMGPQAACAHSIGLRLLLLEAPAAVAPQAPPAWFEAWQQAQATATAPDAVAPERWGGLTAWSVQLTLQHPTSPALLAHQQRRVAALASWLRELLAHGLQRVPPSKGADDQFILSPWWEHERTLLNWELPGLAEAVRQLADQCGSSALTEAAQNQLLAGLGQLYQLTQAFLGWVQLGPGEQQAVRLRAGLPFLDRPTVRAQQPGVADTWHVLAQHIDPEKLWGDSWQQCRTWLWGQATGRYALVLEMQWNHAPFSTELVLARCYAGRLVFYPVPGQWRAVPAADWPAPAPAAADWPAHPPGIRLAELPRGYLAARAQQPWLAEWPVALAPVVPIAGPAGEIYLYDAAAQQRLPLRGTPAEQWRLLAVSGGEPLAVFGEWDGQALLPLAYWLLTPNPTARL